MGQNLIFVFLEFPNPFVKEMMKMYYYLEDLFGEFGEFEEEKDANINENMVEDIDEYVDEYKDEYENEYVAENINEEIINQLYEKYSFEKKEKLEEILEELSMDEIENIFIKKIYEGNFFEKYKIFLNVFSDKELRLVFKELQKQYDFRSYIKEKNPSKTDLKKLRKYHTIKELAKIYRCSESTIKRRLGTKK